MSNPTDDILSALHPDIQEGKYNAADFKLAWEMLDKLEKPVTMGLPACMYDYVKDENGDLVMEEQVDREGNLVSEEKIPARRNRMDVLVILAWIAARRGNPEITIEEVEHGIGDDNLLAISRAIYLFWGVKLQDPEEDDSPLEVTPSEDAPPEISESSDNS